MQKIVIIINGRGGVGKDTLCSIVRKYYKIKNVSAITPIKKIAEFCGWKGEKDEKSREFLSRLKRICIEYNDLPNRYLFEEYNDFLLDENLIMFVHIREKDQIDSFLKMIDCHKITLLVRRRGFNHQNYGNYSDDAVEEYKYNYIYNNDKLRDEIEEDFIRFFNEILKQENIV